MRRLPRAPRQTSPSASQDKATGPSFISLRCHYETALARHSINAGSHAFVPSGQALSRTPSGAWLGGSGVQLAVCFVGIIFAPRKPAGDFADAGGNRERCRELRRSFVSTADMRR
jgi:hypothetical protein